MLGTPSQESETRNVSESGYDVLITGARIVDGTGNPWRYGDVALTGELITKLASPGSIQPGDAREVVAAHDMVICPGFLDILSQSLPGLLRDPRGISKITQGVTTEILGEVRTPAPFGGRIADPFSASDLLRIGPTATMWEKRACHWRRFSDWLDALANHPTSVNLGSFLGGGTVREFVKGYDSSPANTDEVTAMRELVASAMEDGALGLATALIYSPCSFATTDEIVSLAEIVAGYGGIYATHVRSEGNRFLEALDEAIEIGQRVRVPVEVFHLKAAGERNWPKLSKAIARIEAARSEGIDVTADMYPYVGAGTDLTVSLPPWAREEPVLYDRLADPAWRDRFRAEMAQSIADWENLAALAGPDNVFPLALTVPELRTYQGKTLADIAAIRGQDWIDTVMDLLASERQGIFSAFLLMSEENQLLGLKQPWMKIASDAPALDPEWAIAEGPAHPRSYGTFPRVLDCYVREQRVLSVEEAVRKMTSAVADRLGLTGRGLLRAGMHADVVIFDPTKIGDRATFTDPHQLSTGVRDVWVNGTRVLRDSVHTGALPGRVLFGPGRIRGPCKSQVNEVG